jgi:hypothetical protein
MQQYRIYCLNDEGGFSKVAEVTLGSDAGSHRLCPRTESQRRLRNLDPQSVGGEGWGSLSRLRAYRIFPKTGSGGASSSGLALPGNAPQPLAPARGPHSRGARRA